MSFSSEIKEELSRQFSSGRHCQLAELSALLGFVGHPIELKPGKWAVRIHTENLSVARKCFTLLKKTYNIGIDVSVRQNTYQILAYNSLEAAQPGKRPGGEKCML